MARMVYTVWLPGQKQVLLATACNCRAWLRAWPLESLPGAGGRCNLMYVYTHEYRPPSGRL